MSAGDEGRRTYELTVTGVIGPVLRAALPAQRVAIQVPCTVLVVDDAQARRLDELLGLLAAADITVQEIRRLP